MQGPSLKLSETKVADSGSPVHPTRNPHTQPPCRLSCARQPGLCVTMTRLIGLVQAISRLPASNYVTRLEPNNKAQQRTIADKGPRGYTYRTNDPVETLGTAVPFMYMYWVTHPYLCLGKPRTQPRYSFFVPLQNSVHCENQHDAAQPWALTKNNDG